MNKQRIYSILSQKVQKAKKNHGKSRGFYGCGGRTRICNIVYAWYYFVVFCEFFVRYLLIIFRFTNCLSLS